MNGYARISKTLKLMLEIHQEKNRKPFINVPLYGNKELRWSLDIEPSDETPVFFDDTETLFNIFLPETPIQVMKEKPFYRIAVTNMAMIAPAFLTRIIHAGKIPKRIIAKLPLSEHIKIVGQVVTHDYDLVVYPLESEEVILKSILNYK